MNLSEWEAKALAWLIVIGLALSIVAHWFSPQGWIGIYVKEHSREKPR